MKTHKLSTAIASAALVVAALGSTPLGHAAGQLILPKGSVGTPQLKAGAVTGLKVKDGTLAAADFAPGQLPTGAKGDKGDPGPKGDKGDPGATKVTQRVGDTIWGSITALATVSCQPGETLVGGGSYASGNGGSQPMTTMSYPQNNGWFVLVKNINAAGQVYTRAYALCSSP